MVLQYQYVILGVLSLLASSISANAGFDISMWSLRNTVRDSSGPSSVQDTDRITDINNPLDQSSSAQVGDNIAASSYDFSWLEEAGIGDFHTTFDHEMRFTSDISTDTVIQIVVAPTSALMVTVAGQVDYAHTPGDFSEFNFGMSVRDLGTQAFLFQQSREGGNGDFLPAVGTFNINGTAILQPGNIYRLQTVLGGDNILIDDPVGIYDAEGFANFTIRPVPEPVALVPTLIGACWTFRRRERRID